MERGLSQPFGRPPQARDRGEKWRMARYAWVGLESSFGQPATSGRFMDIASEDLHTVHEWILPETAGRREKRMAILGQMHVEGLLS